MPGQHALTGKNAAHTAVTLMARPLSVVLADPVTDVELGAILAVLVFGAWWFSPAQRSQRRREDARNRIALRRALRGNDQPRREP